MQLITLLLFSQRDQLSDELLILLSPVFSGDLLSNSQNVFRTFATIDVFLYFCDSVILDQLRKVGRVIILCYMVGPVVHQQIVVVRDLLFIFHQQRYLLLKISQDNVVLARRGYMELRIKPYERRIGNVEKKRLGLRRDPQ